MPVSLGDLVGELLPDMEFEAKGRNCSVKYVEAASVSVQGNRELLGRAIENVIRNAIAYTAEGTSVEVRLSRQNRFGSEFALLEVKDNGPGVPPDGLKSIFRPFYRLDFSRQRSTGGYGVGLAITERAIRLHGGEVEAANVPGGGLIVAMRLPLAKS
jgi:two-component system sensor histidine kinase CpxA